MHNIQDKINQLPSTRNDVDWKNRISLDLPNVNAEDSTSKLFSKEEVTKWISDFKSKYNESPKFEMNGDKITISNPKFKEAQTQYQSGKQDFLQNVKEMKKSQLVKQIKEEIMSNLLEKKKKEDTEEISTEEETTTEESPASEFGVDPKITTLNSALKAAYDAAKGMGDEKLTTQIGNTITYFTRTHVVNKEGAVSEELKNTIRESIKRVIKNKVKK